MLVGLGVGVDPDHLGGPVGEDIGAVALAAGEVGDAHPVDPRRDPLVDGQVAAEPVVLLGHVGQRPLTGQLERRDALRLVRLDVAPQRFGDGGLTGRRTLQFRAMPAAADATAEHIKDVNTRYHDLAADRTTPSGASTSAIPARPRSRAKLDKALGGRAGEPFDDALEIGAGTGYFSLNLVSSARSSGLTATDISPGDAAARSRRTPPSLGLEVETVATDAERLPFEDESFDLVLGHAVLHHIPDLDRAAPSSSGSCEPGRHGRLLRRAIAPTATARRPAEARGDRRRAALARAVGAGKRGDRRRRRPRLRPRPRGRGRRPRLRPPPIRRLLRRRRLRATSASAARSCSRTSMAGGCAPSSRPPSPDRDSRPAGATSPSAATSPCRRSTPRCSSPACRPSSSTTWSSQPASRTERRLGQPSSVS